MSDPGHRQYILHHAQKPVRILPDVLDQLLLCLWENALPIFQNSGTCTENPGQGGSQIVGNGAQQVAAHLFFLFFHCHLMPFVGKPLPFQRHGKLGQ